MRFSRSEAVALFGWICLTPIVFGQQSGDPQSVPSQNSPAATKPLTPEEQRQKAIDAIDPLAKDPNAGKRPDPRMNQAPPDPNQTDATQNQDTAKPRRAPQPLPGSIAASNVARSADGPQIVGSNEQADPQYNGPAVLSRTYTLQRPMVPKEISWSWSIGSTQTYTTGLLSSPAGAGQPAQTTGSFGEGFTFAINGRHLWKHDQIGLSYNAGYINYGGGPSSYNGLNQTLSFDYAHVISRSLQLDIVETAATFTQGGALSNPLLTPGVSVADLNLAISPTLQPYDLTTRQSNTQVGLTWQKSARLSFSYTAGLFGVERLGADLIGNSGFQGSTDVNYRFTRKTTIGAAYSYTTYSFSHNFAAAHSHTVDLIYSYALGRSAQFRSRLGVSTMDNSGLTQIPVDPAIAALTGQTVALVESRRTGVIPDISAQLAKDFRGRHTASVSYSRGISPGNGTVLSATQESYGVSYGTTLFRRYSFSVSGGRSTLNSALGASPLGGGNFNSEYAGLFVSRPLPRNLSASFGVSYRRYEVTGSILTQPQFSINSAISWGPGEGRLW